MFEKIMLCFTLCIQWLIYLELIKDKRIIQAWRSSEFAEGDLDSILVVNLEEVSGGCRITIAHSQIPKGQGANYKQGWIDYYLLPMKAYFKKI